MPSKPKSGATMARRDSHDSVPVTKQKAGPRTTGLVGADQWRHDNIGRLLNNAIRRFEDRVLELMAGAGYADARISHVNLTRNLDRDGTRLTELASRAGMTKQAMGELVDQCAGIGLVERINDPADKRAKIVRFTEEGIEWLGAFRKAVDRAEHEMRADLGDARHDRVRNALKVYGSSYDALAR